MLYNKILSAIQAYKEEHKDKLITGYRYSLTQHFENVCISCRDVLFEVPLDNNIVEFEVEDIRFVLQRIDTVFNFTLKSVRFFYENDELTISREGVYNNEIDISLYSNLQDFKNEYE